MSGEQKLDDLLACGFIEIAGGFIGHKDCGIGCERAGERNALLLAAGQLRGIVVQAFGEADLAKFFLGAPPFIQPFPGSERALTLAEVQEMQTRLTKAGFDTGGTDGRVGNDTMKAIKDFQVKAGLAPADGYGGLKVLTKLRQGG